MWTKTRSRISISSRLRFIIPSSLLKEGRLCMSFTGNLNALMILFVIQGRSPIWNGEDRLFSTTEINRKRSSKIKLSKTKSIIFSLWQMSVLTPQLTKKNRRSTNRRSRFQIEWNTITRERTCLESWMICLIRKRLSLRWGWWELLAVNKAREGVGYKVGRVKSHLWNKSTH